LLPYLFLAYLALGGVWYGIVSVRSQIRDDTAFIRIEIDKEPALFLVGLILRKGPAPSVESPSGDSTLITSAPRSARSLVPNAAETPAPHSTTLIALNGFCLSTGVMSTRVRNEFETLISP
jgi:hypothetical protein